MLSFCKVVKACKALPLSKDSFAFSKPSIGLKFKAVAIAIPALAHTRFVGLGSFVLNDIHKNIWQKKPHSIHQKYRELEVAVLQNQQESIPARCFYSMLL